MGFIVVIVTSAAILLMTVHFYHCNADESEENFSKYQGSHNSFVKKFENANVITEEAFRNNEITTFLPTTAGTETPAATPDYSTELRQNFRCHRIKVKKLIFPETDAGSWATPTILCLKNDYTPLRLYCKPNGKWSFRNFTKIHCSTKVKETTQLLYNLIENNDTMSVLESTSKIITNKTEELEAVDINYISKILDKASRDENIIRNPEKFTEVVDNIMTINRTKLNSSQKLLNSTDSMLYSLDQLLLKTDNFSHTSNKLLVSTVLKSSDVIGVMVINKENNKNNFKSFQLEYLYRDTYDEKLNTTNYETAFIIAFSNENLHYYITLFYNDYLFNEGTQFPSNVGSWIISILIPKQTSNPKIKIYFKEFEDSYNQSCKYWKYGKEDNVAISGHWIDDGNAIKIRDGFFVCEVNHTTHFGMLVSSSLTDNYILDLISIFGSVLSIVGISIVFLTAITFKEWRNKANSKIILNICFCLLLLIILFLVSDKASKGSFCIFVGIMLHYIVLAQFCWSLTISYSSYRRLRMISHDHISHVVMKFCIFSWGIPLIIVIIIAGISIQTYDKKFDDNNSPQVCYPKDLYLALGVCLPMGIILAINFVVYILIIKNLLVTKLDLRRHVTKKSFSIQKTIILLFFMMAITWIFGFLAAFVDDIVFVYLFCTTATCHGFVIFVFYILDSTEVTNLWKKFINRLCTNKQKERRKSKDQPSTGVEEVTNESNTK